METSTEVRDGWLRFCERMSASDVAAFADVVSTQAHLVIGNAPGEWIDDRSRMRHGFEAERVALAPGAPEGYVDGSLGYVVDQPTFAFPDGSSIGVRVTAVFRQEDATWRLVHMHVSVGVPDDQVVALQEKWGR